MYRKPYTRNQGSLIIVFVNTTVNPTFIRIVLRGGGYVQFKKKLETAPYLLKETVAIFSKIYSENSWDEVLAICRGLI